jgi:hypothetical protein
MSDRLKDCAWCKKHEAFFVLGVPEQRIPLCSWCNGSLLRRELFYYAAKSKLGISGEDHTQNEFLRLVTRAIKPVPAPDPQFTFDPDKAEDPAMSPPG